jgi:glutaredoxin
MFCERAKEYLSQKGIAFQERNILTDPGALDELKKYGYMTTPVTVVGDHVIVGYDTEKILAAVRGT